MNMVGRIIRNRRKELGWTQGRLGLEIGQTIPTISRIESGKRVLSDPELESITHALRLDQVRQKELKEEVVKLRGNILSLVPVFPNEIVIPLSDAVDLSILLRSKIRETREKSDLVNAYKDIEWFGRTLKKWIQSSTTDVIKHALNNERAYILWEKINIISDTSSPLEAWNKIQPIEKELLRSAKLFGDEEIHSMALFVEQGLHYISDDHAKALRYRVENTNIFRDKYLKLAVCRISASSYANLGRQKEAFQELDKIKCLLDSGEIDRPYDILWALDIIGRVYGLTKHPKTFTVFEQAWAFYNKVKDEHGRSRLREVQLAVDELAAVAMLDPHNLSFAEELALFGLNAATAQSNIEPNYPRHVVKINRLLSAFQGG